MPETTLSLPPATALVADDEPPLARELVAALGRLWPNLQVVHVARNGEEAAREIAARRPDLAFLDIRMPGLTGLEVAQGIEGRTRVVFVTAYDSHALEAFEHAAVDYVLKPVTDARLGRTVQRLADTLAQRTDEGDDDRRLAAALQRLLAPAAGTAPAAPRLRFIRASAGDTTRQIAVEEVLFFRADDKYTTVRTASAEHLIRTPIADLVGQLDPALFWQVHRSTIVNLAHLDSTRRDGDSRLFLRLRGHPHELPVSRAYVHLFKAM